MQLSKKRNASNTVGHWESHDQQGKTVTLFTWYRCSSHHDLYVRPSGKTKSSLTSMSSNGFALSDRTKQLPITSDERASMLIWLCVSFLLLSKAMSEIKGQLTALLCKTPHDECGELQWPSSVLQYYIILNSSPVFTAVWVTACFDQRSLPICAMTNLRCPPFFGLQRSPFGPSSFKSLMDTAPMAHLFVQTFLVWWWIVHLCVVLLPSSRYYVCPVASLFSLSCYECSRNSAVCASNNTSNWAK